MHPKAVSCSKSLILWLSFFPLCVSEFPIYLAASGEGFALEGSQDLADGKYVLASPLLFQLLFPAYEVVLCVYNF